ncbi:hypothetical protein BFF78_18265 [Streptomyces fodineus]|uniref:Uncharacterized protein n=1 Tax=Streptomyces fodineus TaxID=1904616 RepID=A0A1D7YAY9_9ACTN|nr:hypothetical protein [Streptomyces fodineus]AOR32751.1 hypothetical protein BFF78_18265 [Streptomyces fodineus]
MTGQSGPIVYATVVGTVILAGGIALWRVAVRLKAQGVEEAKRHKDIALVAAHLSGVAAIGVMTAVIWWHADAQSQPSDSNVLHLTQKMAAEFESGPQPLDVRIDKEPDPGVFTESVYLSIQMDGVGSGADLSAEPATPPTGALDSYTITNRTSHLGSDASDDPGQYQACLIFTSATRAPDLPAAGPGTAPIPQYNLRTRVTAGPC